MPPPPQVLALGGAAAAVGIGYALHRAHERAASEAAKADEARMNEELKRNRERSAEARQVSRLPVDPSGMASKFVVDHPQTLNEQVREEAMEKLHHGW